MTSLYEISYYGIEQYITLTLPAWRCLFTVRNNMAQINTFALHAGRWSSGMSHFAWRTSLVRDAPPPPPPVRTRGVKSRMCPQYPPEHVCHHTFN